METPIEAYDFTLEKVNTLKESGIKVNITPYKRKDDLELVKKYSQPDRIPSRLWVKVSFKNIDSKQSKLIYRTANYLRLCGIRFDTGGCSSCRDWELDWSFSYQKGEEHLDLAEA